jgi:hypothetical protein
LKSRYLLFFLARRVFRHVGINVNRVPHKQLEYLALITPDIYKKVVSKLYGFVAAIVSKFMLDRYLGRYLTSDPITTPTN